MKSILLAVPSPSHVWAKTFIDTVNLACTSCMIYQLGIVGIQGALLPISRDNCVKYAFKHGFDAILFIDSDMRFPADGLIRLIASDKDIIGVNAAVKGEDRNVLTHAKCGTPLYEIDSPLAEVSGIGMAFTLIKMDVFRKMSLPYFYIDYSEDGLSHWGEDMAFTGDAASLGFKVWCDLELSKEIKHIGAHEYETK